MSHLSSLEIDVAALGGLAEARAHHLASCAVCRERADEASALRAELPPALRMPTLAAVVRRRRHVAVLAWIGVPLVVAAAVVLLVGRTHHREDLPELAIKGGPTLQVYALRDQRVFQVHDGDVLAPGDEIRFAVTPAGAAYVLIASVDARRAVTFYVPYEGTQSVAIDPRARTELPGSIVLDDAPGPERLFVLTSTTPILTADVAPALESLAARGPAALRGSPRLDLRVVATQTSLLFEKATR